MPITVRYSLSTVHYKTGKIFSFNSEQLIVNSEHFASPSVIQRCRTIQNPYPDLRLTSRQAAFRANFLVEFISIFHHLHYPNGRVTGGNASCRRKGSGAETDLGAVVRDGRGDKLGLSDFRIFRHYPDNDAAAIFDQSDLLRRLGRLLSHSMEFAPLGKFQSRQMAAGFRLAAFDRAESAGLRRPSFSFSPFADSVSVVF